MSFHSMPNRRLSLVKPLLGVHDPTVLGGTLADWSVWMESAGMSARTIDARLKLVLLFASRSGEDPVTCGWVPVAGFLSNQEFKPGTRQTYLAALRTWFRWLVLMDYRLDDPTMKLHKGKPVHRKPHPVTVCQLGLLLQIPMHRRTKVMILLGAYEGLRVHEIAKFRGQDIDGDMVTVVGKGQRTDDIPLHPLIARAAAVMPPSGFWFPSQIGQGSVLANSVSTIIGDAMKRAEIRNRTAHSLRHFYVTQCLKASGGNLIVAQQLARHANISSTAGYTEVDERERRAAVMGLPLPSYLRIAA